jgi:uncharacterized DUF497 family protein
MNMKFEWHFEKDRKNRELHGVGFNDATKAFFDENRIIFIDVKHSTSSETRYFCLGKVPKGVLTVRFTIRGNLIRIIGAGFWRKGRKRYEEENNLY